MESSARPTPAAAAPGAMDSFSEFIQQFTPKNAGVAAPGVESGRGGEGATDGLSLAAVLDSMAEIPVKRAEETSRYFKGLGFKAKQPKSDGGGAPRSERERAGRRKARREKKTRGESYAERVSAKVRLVGSAVCFRPRRPTAPAQVDASTKRMRRLARARAMY